MGCRALPIGAVVGGDGLVDGLASFFEDLGDGGGCRHGVALSVGGADALQSGWLGASINFATESAGGRPTTTAGNPLNEPAELRGYEAAG